MSEVREGYKMTELGEIPSNWEVIKLNDGVGLLTDYTANGSFASLKENVTYFREPNYALLVRTTDLQHNNFDSGNVYTDQRGYDFLKKSALFGGELIMNNVGAGAGQVFIMPFLNRKATIAPNALVFKFNDKLESNFMYHFFKSSIGQNELYKLSPTGALKNINKTLLKELVFAAPPIKEQQKIASILSTVDEQIDETEQLIVKTKELKKGLMQQLLTKGIGHTEFKQTELGDIPLDWKVVKFKDCCTIVSGLVDPNDKIYSEYPHIGNANIAKRSGKLLSYKLVKDENLISGKFLFDERHVLYGKINPHFAKATYPKFKGLCSADMYPIESNSKVLIADYLLYSILDERFTKAMTANSARTGIPKVNKQEMDSYKFILPSIEEQQKISSILSTVDAQIGVYEEEKAKYEKLKKGLMQKLLTGQIRVKI